MKKTLLALALSALTFNISAAELHKPDAAFINDVSSVGLSLPNWDYGKSTKLTLKNAYRFTHNIEMSKGEFVHDLGNASGFDLDSVSAHDFDGELPMSVILRDRLNQESLVILKDGQLVDEYYWNGMNKDATHLQRSITKSFTALTLAVLAEQGKVDMNAPITQYVPELKASPAFSKATVQEVADMRSGIKATEAESWDLMGSVQEWNGPDTLGRFGSIVDYGATVPARDDVQSGEEYEYLCVNTEMLGMVITRVTGQPVAQVMEDVLWKKAGFEHNAHFMSNSKGEAVASAGLNATGRDVAVMMDILVNDGKNRNGEQVIPQQFINNLLEGNDDVRNAWALGKESKSIKDGWYKDQIRTFNHAGHTYLAFVGINGQVTVGEPATGIVLHMNGAQDETKGDRAVAITFLDVIPTLLSAVSTKQ
ncbi:beta-lactamase family protein [Vibrio kyushuensis]|uniref:serine hydrolase domain-containing protein n=1 Tax=Vibrio kyushuensis TaxID=2910249 RepID=UPI003D0A9BF5